MHNTKPQKRVASLSTIAIGLMFLLMSSPDVLQASLTNRGSSVAEPIPVTDALLQPAALHSAATSMDPTVSLLQFLAGLGLILVGLFIHARYVTKRKPNLTEQQY